jgi:hypothetical protein
VWFPFEDVQILLVEHINVRLLALLPATNASSLLLRVTPPCREPFKDIKNSVIDLRVSTENEYPLVVVYGVLREHDNEALRIPWKELERI